MRHFSRKLSKVPEAGKTKRVGEKGKPLARVGRKAPGPTWSAELPPDLRSVVCLAHRGPFCLPCARYRSQRYKEGNMFEKMRKRMSGEGGFTLIELLVVIIIIAILAAIAIPTFLGQRQKAQDAAAKSLVRNAMTAVESQYVDTRTFDSRRCGWSRRVGRDRAVDHVHRRGGAGAITGAIAAQRLLPSATTVLSTTEVGPPWRYCIVHVAPTLRQRLSASSSTRPVAHDLREEDRQPCCQLRLVSLLRLVAPAEDPAALPGPGTPTPRRAGHSRYPRSRSCTRGVSEHPSEGLVSLADCSFVGLSVPLWAMTPLDVFDRFGHGEVPRS